MSGREAVPYCAVSISRCGGRTGHRNVVVLAALGLVTAVGASGCADAEADPPPVAAPVATAWPASVAGGACELLDYATIEAAIEVRFDVAAASEQGKTNTCVVRHSGAGQPELMLAVSPTTVGTDIFRSTVAPSKAQKVSGLGKAAYQARIAAGKADGPGVEVGWLSGDNQLVSLRFTFPLDTDPAEADALATPLVDLAKQLDKIKTKS